MARRQAAGHRAALLLCSLRLGACGTLAMLSTGCSVSDLATADRLARGLVVVLPGIEGRSRLNIDIARGLNDGGVGMAVEIFDWNAPVPFVPLVNLADLERNKAQAKRLAQRIEQYHRDYPGRDVYVIGHSAGGGIALLTVEALPRQAPVTAAVLLAPAVSPEYDLTEALRRTRVGIFSFHSPSDVLFLELGTRTFGTVDRRLGSAAGASGFRPPATGTARDLYDQKLIDIGWRKEMSRSGNGGDHFGWANPLFVRDYLAPLIVDQQTGEWPSGVWADLIESARVEHHARAIDNNDAKQAVRGRK